MRWRFSSAPSDPKCGKRFIPSSPKSRRSWAKSTIMSPPPACTADWLDRVEDPDVADLLRPLIDEEHQAIEQGRHEFLAWWTAGRSADLRRRFDEQFAAQRHGQSA